VHKINHPDYSRDFLLKAREHPTTDSVRISAHLKEAQKFILPDGGELLHDKHLKGIDETLRLCLPFPTMALEWPDTTSIPRPKKILLLRELDADIELQPLAYDARHHKWGWLPAVYVNRDMYIERKLDGHWATYVRYKSREDKEYGERTEFYIKYLYTFLALINALSCKNVVTERSTPGAMRALKARKSQVPFDSYHVLAIRGSANDGNRGGGGSRAGALHASPRMHVRMGHIVRSKHGAYWRNSCVVNPDAEHRVTKAYRLAA
jgi:hypothetical protein